MLDYKDIIIKHYGLGLSGSAISKQLGVSKSGVNDFIRAFERSDKLSYPLPDYYTTITPPFHSDQHRQYALEHQ